MAKPVTLSLDAMGGDRGAEVAVPGAALALVRCPETRFIFYGDEAVVAPLVAAHPALAAVSEIRHCDVFVRMDDKPSQALRHGRRRSSMWRAIEAVRLGDADAAISAGNTGALMAMAKFCLRTMEGIERPAIAAIWPTLRGESIVLDVGATIGADTRQLLDFALLGGAMARSILGVERPSVGLLNVGVEEIKGLDAVREANQVLRDHAPPTMKYHGFVEGDDIGYGTVDVVVTEGFSGNIALKTAEGTSKQFSTFLRSAMQRSLITRIGFLLSRGAFRQVRAKLTPRAVGGTFLGLNGLVVKTHGGTDPAGFASAVELAHDMVRNQLLPKIAGDVANARTPAVLADQRPEVDALS